MDQADSRLVYSISTLAGNVGSFLIFLTLSEWRIFGVDLDGDAG